MAKKIAIHNESIEMRFLKKIKFCIHGMHCEKCCWEWIAGKQTSGHGSFHVSGNSRKRNDIHALPHVFMYEFVYGPIKDRLKDKVKVCHTCDNPSCCNYHHLYKGTQYDNIQDRVKRNRNAIAEKHGKHKLTREQVQFIRVHYVKRSREYGSVALASMFHVSYQTILSIVQYKHRIQG